MKLDFGEETNQLTWQGEEGKVILTKQNKKYLGLNSVLRWTPKNRIICSLVL